MAKSQRVVMTDQERAERRRQEHELTERAVVQLRSSAGWQRWLKVNARAGLRRYSVLIWSRSVVAAAAGGAIVSMTCRARTAHRRHPARWYVVAALRLITDVDGRYGEMGRHGAL